MNAAATGTLDEATPAEASGGGYALVRLANPTGRTLYYTYRWDEAGWRTACLYPGQCRLHCLECTPGGRRPPALHVRFDHTLHGSEYASKAYALTCRIHPSPEPENASEYAFDTSVCGCRVDLYIRA
jgi:hypothetical protein